MGIKVCKFGGSSLADAGMIQKVRDIVAADPERRFVVPSAPGKRWDKDRKITDLLYLCHEHAKQDMPFDGVFEMIAERYHQIAADLGLSLDLAPHLDEVRSQIANGASADYTASRGEHLNGVIIAALLGCELVDAAEIIRFDHRGRFDPDTTHDLVAERLKPLDRAVIPGFYGANAKGTIRTFSRGGSDVTGAIVARGVDAEMYENWTDVSGLLMADPRIVENPRTIEVMTYSELRELTYMGARAFHDEAIFPVREAGISVNIRNTNEPDHPGTTIVKDEPSSKIVKRGDELRRLEETPPDEIGMAVRPAITGVAGRKDFTIIAISKALMNTEVGYARRLLDVLDDNDISFEHMPSGIDTVSVVVEDERLEGKLDAVLDGIRAECKPDDLEIYDNIALVATVGRGMMYTPGMAAKLFTALAEAEVNVRMIDQGSGELNIIVGVDGDDLEDAVRAIYRAFVE